MTTETKREYVDRIADEYELPLMTMDGYDDCIVGVAFRMQMPLAVIYDRFAVMCQLKRENNWSDEEAMEYHDFNQAQAWVGDHTPIFLETPDAS